MQRDIRLTLPVERLEFMLTPLIALRSQPIKEGAAEPTTSQYAAEYGFAKRTRPKRTVILLNNKRCIGPMMLYEGKIA